jgi:hypothetical protein
MVTLDRKTKFETPPGKRDYPVYTKPIFKFFGFCLVMIFSALGFMVAQAA